MKYNIYRAYFKGLNLIFWEKLVNSHGLGSKIAGGLSGTIWTGGSKYPSFQEGLRLCCLTY